MYLSHFLILQVKAIFCVFKSYIYFLRQVGSSWYVHKKINEPAGSYIPEANLLLAVLKVSLNIILILLYLDDIFRFLCCFYKLFGNEAMFLFNDSKKNDIMWNVIKDVIFVKSHLTTFSKITLYYLFVKRI